MLMTLSATVETWLRRWNYARRWHRGLRTAGFNCIRKRPRSFTAKMQIALEPIPSVPSTFWAIRLVQDHRETLVGDILLAFYQRSPNRPPTDTHKEDAVV